MKRDKIDKPPPIKKMSIINECEEYVLLIPPKIVPESGTLRVRGPLPNNE